MTTVTATPTSIDDELGHVEPIPDMPLPADTSHRRDTSLLISQKLYHEAKLRNISRHRVAMQVGEPPRTVIRTLAQDYRVSGLLNLERIARALGVRIVLEAAD